MLPTRYPHATNTAAPAIFPLPSRRPAFICIISRRMTPRSRSALPTLRTPPR